MMLPGSFLNALHIERSPLNPYVNVHRNRTRTLFFAGRFCTNRKEPLINTWPNCAPVLNAPDTFSAGEGLGGVRGGGLGPGGCNSYRVQRGFVFCIYFVQYERRLG